MIVFGSKRKAADRIRQQFWKKIPWLTEERGIIWEQCDPDAMSKTTTQQATQFIRQEWVRECTLIGESGLSEIQHEVEDKVRRLYRYNRALSRFTRVVASASGETRKLVLDSCMRAITTRRSPENYLKDKGFAALFVELQAALKLNLLTAEEFQEFIEISRDPQFIHPLVALIQHIRASDD